MDLDVATRCLSRQMQLYTREKVPVPTSLNVSSLCRNIQDERVAERYASVSHRLTANAFRRIRRHPLPKLLKPSFGSASLSPIPLTEKVELSGSPMIIERSTAYPQVFRPFSAKLSTPCPVPASALQAINATACRTKRKQTTGSCSSRSHAMHRANPRARSAPSISALKGRVITSNAEGPRSPRMM